MYLADLIELARLLDWMMQADTITSPASYAQYGYLGFSGYNAYGLGVMAESCAPRVYSFAEIQLIRFLVHQLLAHK